MTKRRLEDSIPEATVRIVVNLTELRSINFMKFQNSKSLGSSQRFLSFQERCLVVCFFYTSSLEDVAVGGGSCWKCHQGLKETLSRLSRCVGMA